MRTLEENAERIIKGYREVCTMTPHVPCRPEESSDNAVRLAVHYLKLQEVRNRLVKAYTTRDDTLFDDALCDMLGNEKTE